MSLQVQGWSSTAVPPPKLKLDYQKEKAPSAAPVVPGYPATPGAPPVIPGYPYTPGPYGPYGPYSAPTPYIHPSQYSPYAHMHSPHGYYSRRQGQHDTPSSDPMEELEDASLFPRLNTWLQNLDNGPQGHDGHDFASFAPSFEAEKYVRVSDIETLTVEEILTVCPGMARGTATKLTSFAKQECKNVRKKEKLRAKKLHHY